MIWALVALASVMGGCGDGGDDASYPRRLPDPANFTTTTTNPPATTSTGASSAAPPPASEDFESAACLEVVASLGPSDGPEPLTDLVELVLDDRLVGLAIAGHGDRELVAVQVFDRPEDLIFPSTAAPDEQLASLRGNQLIEAVDATYLHGPDQYGVLVLAFPTADRSRAYLDVYLRAVCGTSAVAATRVPETSSGVTFGLASSPAHPTNLAMSIGRYAVILTLCDGLGDAEHRGVVADWADLIRAQAGARPSSRV